MIWLILIGFICVIYVFITWVCKIHHWRNMVWLKKTPAFGVTYPRFKFRLILSSASNYAFLACFFIYKMISITSVLRLKSKLFSVMQMIFDMYILIRVIRLLCKWPVVSILKLFSHVITHHTSSLFLSTWTIFLLQIFKNLIVNAYLCVYIHTHVYTHMRAHIHTQTQGVSTLQKSLLKNNNNSQPSLSSVRVC